MSKPAFTLKAFGIYLMVLGVSLAVAPNLMLSLFGMPPTTEVWLRVLGVVVFNIGVYYIYAAKCEARAFFQASVYTRCLVMAAFIAFAALGLAPPMLVLFGAADLLGAVWTQLALRAERPA
ncbi:MAG TPA: hypothetical protein VFY73_04530 [Ideonella sp.]|uniref:hypothetical protein n=1 Tax=Ideonella sp. TaxID=1929293 RepID=UPI002E355575|nr:hypothetical protein [Ideonella sp.]HEX5683282.1 hypothetical protein [Ideonella sp.]